MVKKILNIFNKETSGINEAAFLLGLFAFVSQLLGLFRDRALAHYLGPSKPLDVYYAAFRVPDFLFISIASIVSITVLIPFLINKLSKGEGEEKKEAKKFFNDIFTAFFFGMIFICFIAFLLMPYIAPYIAPGFGASELHDLVVASRIMLLSPILLGLSNLFGTITQVNKKFLIFSLSPVFYNLGIIIGIFFFYPIWGVYGLIVGVVFGALLHLLIQLPIAFKHGFRPSFSRKIDWVQMKKVVLTSFPRTIALSLYNISIITIIAFASTIKEGSISIFNFAFNLESVPVGIIGISYSVAAFPTLAKTFSLGDREKFVKQITASLKQIIFWSLPVVFLFVVLRAQIVRVILGSGSFTWDDTRLTAACLAIFSFSIIAQNLLQLFTRGYYAAGKTKRPLIINLIFYFLIIALCYILLRAFNNFPYFKYFMESILRVEDIKGTALLVLPLAYTIGTLLNLTAMWISFKNDFFKEFSLSISKTFFQSFSASFIMGTVAYQFLSVFDINRFWGVLLQGLCSGLIGIIVGVIMLKLLKNEELESIIKTLKSKFWKTKITVSPQDDLQGISGNI